MSVDAALVARSPPIMPDPPLTALVRALHREVDCPEELQVRVTDADGLRVHIEAFDGHDRVLDRTHELEAHAPADEPLEDASTA